jgi:hypothetical protein
MQEVSLRSQALADSTWAAMKGRKALEVEYDYGPDAGLSSAGISKLFDERQDADGVAQALRVAPEKITEHVTFVGGAFGRRIMPDFVIEAVQASKAAGTPVQVVWSREDDWFARR